jgi:hypothetical protein
LDNKAFVIVDIAVIDSKIKYNNKTYVKVVWCVWRMFILW